MEQVVLWYHCKCVIYAKIVKIKIMGRRWIELIDGLMPIQYAYVINYPISHIKHHVAELYAN